MKKLLILLVLIIGFAFQFETPTIAANTPNTCDQVAMCTDQPQVAEVPEISQQIHPPEYIAMGVADDDGKPNFIKYAIKSIGLDGWGIISILLALVSLVFGRFWAKAKVKLRQAGELLITVADVIEDKKIDANERIDLAKRARELIGKKSENE